MFFVYPIEPCIIQQFIQVDGRWYGVLSYSIGKALDRLPDWAEDTDRFLREVDKRVRRMSPFQTPVFEITK